MTIQVIIDAIYDAETIDFDVWYNFYVELSNNQVVWYIDGQLH